MRYQRDQRETSPSTFPDVSNLSPYHRDELSLVFDPSDPRRCVPSYDSRGWSILDVGCGSGQTLVAPEISSAARRCGVDIDATAIDVGRRCFRDLELEVGRAEALPYPSETFDLTMSRVGIVYANIPCALREMYRVTKPGGRIWLSLHPWSKIRADLLKALCARNWKSAASRLFVICNGLHMHFTGRCFVRPDRRDHETFQTERGMRRALHAAGFVEVTFEHGRHFIATAVRPN